MMHARKMNEASFSDDKMNEASFIPACDHPFAPSLNKVVLHPHRDLGFPDIKDATERGNPCHGTWQNGLNPCYY